MRLKGRAMDVIYHIGLPKTGTTFLQSNYFPHLHGDVYVPPKGSPMDPAIREWISFVRGQTTRVPPWDPDSNKAKVVIYSAEEIAVSWMRRPAPGHCYPDWTPSEIGEVLDRMVSFHEAKFGTEKAHILVGFRSLETFLPSYFAQFGYRHLPPCARTFSDLLDFVEESPQRFSPPAIQSALEQRFSEVFCYRQELLSESNEALNQWISDFGLNGVHITSQRRNARATMERDTWRQRRLVTPGSGRSLTRLLPKSFKRAIWNMITSGRFERFLSKDFQPTEAERLRLKSISETLE